MIEISRALTERLRPLSFSTASHVYLPTDYARKPHEAYLKRFGKGPKRVLFLGMNPGPWGMAQTGVPFGEIPAVKDWMGIDEPVGKPDPEHPKRRIEGFACQRSEVSGRRLWGYFAEKYPQAEDFFAGHFVANYCPLVWMGETGANITPDKLPSSEMEPVEDACMEHLAKLLEILRPQYLIGVGAYAEAKLATAAEVVSSTATVGRVLHPSPASPAANRGWAEAAEKQLKAQGVLEG
ncbi:single-strand selective monofunctional uracil DNA glycosylase [Haloferula helveola]|uniref:Single-strand selective monofunctional uracil DNA glycosylase n=1 Tax=Haloferula helveola TaxID=490095 RepID=A0ABN6H0Y1_9BACT|nr:single-strand selective monofunctional uracil DNA glycosylase [Haloferula helveola]